MMSSKAKVVLTVLGFGLWLTVQKVSAEASAKVACVTGKVLGLCSSAEEKGAGKRSLSAGWYNLKANAAKVSPNRFMQLVQLFVDDLQVAEMGAMRIKVNLSIK